MSTLFVTTSAGVRIAYDVTGQGPALMLLHGAGKTRKAWHKVGYVDRLREDFRVICVDVRGSGDSDCLTGINDYAIGKICEDLMAVADACGEQGFGVWGYSFGGNIARYLGAWSDRVKAMAMIGVPFGPAVHEDFDRYIETFIVKYGPLATAYHEGELSEKQRKSAIKGRIPVWVACFQAMRSWPSTSVEDVRCPALLLAGTKNGSLLEWLKENETSAVSAGIQVEIVDGLSHQQEFSHIEQVYPIVQSFFEGKWSAEDFHA